MFTFLATTILMSRNKKLDIKDYWSTDPLLSSPIFRQITSRNKYLLLLQMLHFCNNDNQEKRNRLFKLDIILDEIHTNFKAGMVPFQNIVIDESLVLWKDRLSFKQFIKTKRHRFGIKLFVLCDIETDFILDFIMYTEAETRLLPYDANIGISGAVVKTYIAPYLNKGYNLYTDNWFTSLILAKYLFKKKKKTTITGTVKKNR
uniref:PiggyBac transposable element-derived protein 4 n=1 Tax=Melanaphis sacchari TaxID=742174 RepID=A0A2H8TWM1_9HEMI